MAGVKLGGGGWGVYLMVMQGRELSIMTVVINWVKKWEMLRTLVHTWP